MLPKFGLVVEAPTTATAAGSKSLSNPPSAGRLRVAFVAHSRPGEASVSNGDGGGLEDVPGDVGGVAGGVEPVGWAGR